MPNDFFGEVSAWSDSAMVQKAAVLRTRYAICAGWAYDGGDCQTKQVLLVRFCRPSGVTGFSSQTTEGLRRGFIDKVRP